MTKSSTVTPAKAGVQDVQKALDSRLRGNDGARRAIFLVLALSGSLFAQTTSSTTAPPAAAPTYALPVYAASTAPLTVDSILERFKDYDRRMDTLSADFNETLDNDVMRSSQAVAGTFRYKKPDLFRLEESVPGPESIVADGAHLWIWRPDTGQLIKTKISDWQKQDVMAESFIGIGNYEKMLKRYEVSVDTVSAPDARGISDVALKLTPKKKKKGSDFSLKFYFSTRDFFPGVVEIEGEGLRLRSELSHIRYNIPIATDTFHFAVPDGADVFEAPAGPKD